MNMFFDEILNEVRDKYGSIKFESNEIEIARKMISYLHEKLELMKKHLLDFNFSTAEEEIHFFKEIKPEIHGLLIFYKHVYCVETTCPIGNAQKNIQHYTNYLEKVSKSNKRYYRSNSFYQYIKSGRTDKDYLYFLRQKNDDIVYSGDQTFTFFDLQFSTFYDSVFSLIKAEEKLHIYVNSKIDESPRNSINVGNLDWSNSKSSMIELIYALHISKSIPKSNIRKIANVFEQIFDIKLGDIHHTYHRMKYRTDSRTLFLDQLKQALETHLGESDR